MPNKKTVGWVVTKFTDVLDVQGGTQPPKTQFISEPKDGYVRLLQIRDFGKKPVPTYVPDTTKLKKCSFDDVLIGRYGASLGRICSGMEGAYNVALAKIIAPTELDTSFIRYYLLGDLFQHPLKLLSRSAQNGFNKKDLGSFDFVLPPLAEQKQIAAKLDQLLAQVDTLKTRLDAIPDILKRFRQSVLAAAVSGRLTEEWRIENKKLPSHSLDTFEHQIKKTGFKRKAKDLSDILISPTHPSWVLMQFGHIFNVKSGEGLTAKKMVSDGGIPVYGGNGINGYHNSQNVFEKTLVIGRVGFYCGSVHLTGKKAWITDNALIVSYPNGNIDKFFAHILLQATNLRADSASTAQPVISGAKIYPLQINLPSLEEQTEIVRRVEQLFTFAEQVEQRLKDAQSRVDHLTQSILAKAFRGELTAEWREQNPQLISGEHSAEALLQRIKAQRESAPAKKRRRKKSTA